MASRTLKVAAAQMGTTNYTDARSKTLNRMLALLDDAAAKGAQLVLFPETAFTTFFPRHLINDPVELDSFFEHGDIVTQPQTKPLFDKATECGTDIAVGFAEKTDDGETFNSCVYFHAKSGSILSKYRKIHLPGDFEPFADPDATNQLEKRYFKPGDLGFNAFRVPDLVPSSPERGDPIFGMMICNDRRWAESWRVLGLQGVEVVLCGYNTAGFAPHLWGSSADMDPDEARSKALFHHKLVMQAHSYTNACFSISAARCGLDDGKYDLIGGSCITGPEGELIAEASTTEDEVVYAEINLDACRPGKERTFDFARHRRVEHYSCITEQTGVIEPPKLGPQGRTLVNGVHGKDKKIRVLLVNPNSTRAMTDACVAMVESQLPSDVIVTGFTAPRPSPSAIEGSFDNVMSAAAAARAVLPLAATHDAVLVACYSDHALIRMLREELPRQPVIGIMEASLFAARTLGGRFGLIAVSERSRVLHEDSIHHYGFSTSCAGVLSCGLGVLDLHEKSQDEVMGIMADVGKRLVEEKGADVLLLGCAGMTPLKPAVEAAVGDDVQVVDGVLAGVHHLVGLVRMGGATAKRGVYKSSAAGRKARGQDWI
ncbi:carbon-nitrogen hydrolase [Colletotrichum tabaci]|uniref:Carbon-nitrogen hydrolase n=1 Tax=Colletotrichum tabaci TaxID=1209068 RepID=A0AAV9SW78_9PEZI